MNLRGVIGDFLGRGSGADSREEGGNDQLAPLSAPADAGVRTKENSPHLSRAAYLCAVAGTVFMAGVLAVHIGLLTRGSWGGDEYRTFAAYRDVGIGYLWFRFWSWSPRPLSEVLIWFYALAVNSFRQSLIIPVLVVIWLTLLGAAGSALCRCTRQNIAPRALAATVVLTFIVLGRHVSAVLYWPIGGLAYAPVIAAFTFMLFFLANEHKQGDAGRMMVSLLLVAAAWSAEAGALLVLIFSVMALLVLILQARVHGYSQHSMAYWLPPLLASLLVIGMIADNGRVTDPKVTGGDLAIYHQTFASFSAALARWPLEFMSLDGETFDRPHLVRGVLAKLLFFIGMHCCWMTTGRGRPLLLVLAASITIGTFGMLMASFREFGSPCCGQHAFVRQSLELIAVAAVAIWVPPLFTISRSWLLIAASAALSIGVGILLDPRIKEFRRDYAHYGEAARARERTWDSGFSSGPAMTLYQSFSGDIFPAQIPPGFQVASDNWWAPGILNFFHKESVLVLMPSTHERE
jgi:hypothetical protein